MLAFAAVHLDGHVNVFGVNREPSRIFFGAAGMGRNERGDNRVFPGADPPDVQIAQRGIAVLVEKPLAATPAEADRIVEAAAENGVPVAVGHVERFNPAVQAIKEGAWDFIEKPLEPVAPDAQRFGPRGDERRPLAFEQIAHRRRFGHRSFPMLSVQFCAR